MTQREIENQWAVAKADFSERKGAIKRQFAIDSNENEKKRVQCLEQYNKTIGELVAEKDARIDQLSMFKRNGIANYAVEYVACRRRINEINDKLRGLRFQKDADLAKIATEKRDIRATFEENCRVLNMESQNRYAELFSMLTVTTKPEE